jgi:hypothetical protein
MDKHDNGMAAGSRPVARLWFLRGVALLGGLGGVLLLLRYDVTHYVPMAALLAAETVIILAAVAIAVYAELTFRDSAMSGPDARLVHRLKSSSARHLVLMAFAMPLILGLFWLSRYEWHLSIVETLALATTPSMAIAAGTRVFWPVSAGSGSETVRANLLMVDRLRRQQAFGYALFAALLGVNVILVMPQLQHALRGQPIRLDNFEVLAISGFLSLFFLSQPSRWFERADVRRVTQDESLTQFRLLAFRNGFYVMGLGMVLVCDAVRSPPRLAIVLIPIVLSVSLMVTLLTLVWLEYWAGTFTAEAGDGAAA